MNKGNCPLLFEIGTMRLVLGQGAAEKIIVEYLETEIFE